MTDNCTGQTLIDSSIVSVPVYPPLTLTLSPDISEICPYITHTFYGQVTGGNGVYSYTWKKVGSPSILSTADSLTVTPNSTSSYIFTAIDGLRYLHEVLSQNYKAAIA